MRAVILAGGKGTRLRPYTTLIPKPLVPVAGEKSILEVNLDRLVTAGFTRATLAVNHYAHLIQSYFGDGSRFGLSIDYSLETEELGTMGPLRLIQDLPENFLVMNGDVLTNLNFAQFLSEHEKSGAVFTIASFARTQKVDFGVLDVRDGVLRGFTEKPLVNYEVSMGVYGVNRSVLAQIATNRPFGFDELMLSFIDREINVRVIRHNGKWLDVGRPEDYEAAQEQPIDH